MAFEKVNACAESTTLLVEGRFGSCVPGMTVDADAKFEIEICYIGPTGARPYINSINLDAVRICGVWRSREWLVGAIGDDAVVLAESWAAHDMERDGDVFKCIGKEESK